MKQFSCAPSRGFTLIELLTAITILAVLVAAMSQLLISAQSVTSGSRRLLDADDVARLTFARMGNDFGGLVNRNDVDMIFAKQAVGGVDGNDKIFFYSQAAGDTTGVGAAFPIGAENPVSLTGYLVAADPTIAGGAGPIVLQRLGRALNWLPSTGPDTMVYLSPKVGAAAITYFDPYSTLNGHWPATIGAAPAYAPVADASHHVDASYHVLGDLIFRFEYCFLLKDGSYSDYPVEQNPNNVPATPLPSGANATAMSTHMGPPTSNDDSFNTAGDGPYSVAGSRWLDIENGRAYLCTSGGATAGTAVWSGLGMQDVAAVIVTFAVLDRDSRTLLINTGGAAALQNLANQFVDSATGLGGTGFVGTGTPGAMFKLPQQTWQNALDTNTIALAGVPVGIAAQVLRNVRVYQRFFYLNPAVPTS